ncbi:Pr6Pr family membrane protein [Demequina sp. SYSU T00192]|uniref:Pr6Pr family membrane protein n=1 Tax=Demequina litoralis TaxID=3051660 RepID=A0ABT8G5I2_9MICO|nr:Pr6Pr family membrane protein [Demequina sp. SYSU T00192]MDN4474377.1 Pr6Pr family membrane protein [Demequina sp. SYSU T00192]
MSKDATIRTLRLIGASVILSALGFQAWADLTYGTFTWGQLPGYFTPLANLAGIVALLAASRVSRPEARWVTVLRVNSATYLVVVGAVYWALLAPFTTPYFPWANAILHGGSGAILVLDWILIGGRRRLPLGTLWSVLGLPAAWVSYLLFRAFLDGWVPYPFLDPARGLAAILATLGAIAAVGLGVSGILRVLAVLRPATFWPGPVRARVPARGAQPPRD